MIKKFINRLLGKGGEAAAAAPAAAAPAAPRIPTGKRVEVPASAHGIDPISRGECQSTPPDRHKGDPSISHQFHVG